MSTLLSGGRPDSHQYKSPNQQHDDSIQTQESPLAPSRDEQTEYHVSQESLSNIQPFEEAKLEAAQPGHDDSKEWMPHLLRRPESGILALILICLIALLEALNYLDRKERGFSVGEHVRTFSRYFPTIIAVLLSFIWEVLLGDLKEMGPWSLMARGWVKAEESLLLVNYVDTMDALGIVMSMRKRQYGITLGYIGALLCGALIPFANNLFFIDPVPRITTSSQAITRTSHFALNDSFTGNGGIAQNTSYFDPQSFLTYMAVERENYDLPNWTDRQHAFDSFNVSDSVITQLQSELGVNMTVSAEVDAFEVKTSCDPISYTFYNTSNMFGFATTHARLLPDANLLEKAKCHINPTDYPSLSLDTHNPLRLKNVSAWMNYTTCGDWQCPSSLVGPFMYRRVQNCGEKESNDLRLTLNLWDPTTFNGNLSLLSNSSATVSGLLCKISFYLTKRNIQVDVPTARLVQVDPKPISSHKLDVKNPESIVLKINQFLKLSSTGEEIRGQSADYRFPQEVFLDDPIIKDGVPKYFGPGETGYFPGSVRPDAYTVIRVDPIIRIMSSGSNRRISDYSKNMTAMVTDLSNLLQGLVSQIVHTSYRLPDNSQIQGIVTSTTTVLRMRQVSFRILEAMLAALAVITVLSSTFFRLRTDLRSDPRSLGAIGILLCRSPRFLTATQGTGSMTRNVFLDHLKGTLSRTAVEDGQIVIHVQKDDIPITEPAINTARHPPGKNNIYQVPSLHWISRILLFLAFVAMIAGLGISWWQNKLTSGYGMNTQQETYAVIFVPSILLVLLGYAVNSVNSALQHLQPYSQISKTPLPARIGLGLTPITRSAFQLGIKTNIHNKNYLLIFSSAIKILITVIKIVTAALFVAKLQPYVTPTTLSIDPSLVTNLASYNLSSFYYSNPQEHFLRTRAMTLIQFASVDRTSAAPIGLADGIVFSNITDFMADIEMNQILDSGASAELRVPAIQITPECESFKLSNYGKITPSRNLDDVSTIMLYCDKGPGLAKCPGRVLDQVFNTSSVDHPEDIQFYWNSQSLFQGFTPFVPTSPEQDREGNTRRNVTSLVLAKATGSDPYAGSFKVTDVASFRCRMNILPIYVNVTANRASRTLLNVQKIQPLAVKSYDPLSIAVIGDQKPYEDAQLNWTNIADGAIFRSIYSLRGRNVLYNIINMLNPNVTDEQFVKSPDLLAKAGGQVAMRFAAQMINLARPFVDPMTPAQAKASVATAHVITTKQRLVQSKEITIVLQVLLGVMLLCFLVVALGVDTKVGLTKSPSSIGVQAGLLADSELIRLARQKIDQSPPGVGTTDRDLWNSWDGYMVSLGWWDVDNPISASDTQDLGDGQRRPERYGIDIGYAEQRR